MTASDFTRPMGVSGAEQARAGAARSGEGERTAVPVPAPAALLDILVAGLRGPVESEGCFLCSLDATDERNLCAEHQRRLAAIVNYGTGRAA